LCGNLSHLENSYCQPNSYFTIKFDEKSLVTCTEILPEKDFNHVLLLWFFDNELENHGTLLNSELAQPSAATPGVYHWAK